MRILSIQSHVAYGYAGNSAAVFPLQRLGHEVYAVLTVTFSNHTGYGAVRGPLIAPDDVREVINGVEDRGAFPTIDAVLSGYQGAEAVGEVVLDAVARVKAANPNAVYCCDPVMGDVGRGFFVRPGIPEYMRDSVVPAADLVTPNQFELEFLTGVEVGDLDDALGAADEAKRLGPETVLTTSLRRTDAPVDTIEMLAVSGEGAWLVGTPLLALEINGAGDATAALFLAHLLRDETVAQALSMTASAVHAVLEETHRRGSREMTLVPAQQSIVDPPRRFEARQVR